MLTNYLAPSNFSLLLPILCSPTIRHPGTSLYSCLFFAHLLSGALALLFTSTFSLLTNYPPACIFSLILLPFLCSPNIWRPGTSLYSCLFFAHQLSASLHLLFTPFFCLLTNYPALCNFSLLLPSLSSPIIQHPGSSLYSCLSFAHQLPCALQLLFTPAFSLLTNYPLACIFSLLLPFLCSQTNRLPATFLYSCLFFAHQLSGALALLFTPAFLSSPIILCPGTSLYSSHFLHAINFPISRFSYLGNENFP